MPTVLATWARPGWPGRAWVNGRHPSRAEKTEPRRRLGSPAGSGRLSRLAVPPRERFSTSSCPLGSAEALERGPGAEELEMETVLLEIPDVMERPSCGQTKVDELMSSGAPRPSRRWKSRAGVSAESRLRRTSPATKDSNRPPAAGDP
jgi:hypothetical protein